MKLQVCMVVPREMCETNIQFQEYVVDKKKTWARGSNDCVLSLTCDKGIAPVLESMVDELKTLVMNGRKDLDDIKQSMSFINKNFEDLKTLTSQMQNSIGNVTKLVASITKAVNITNKEQAQIKEELSDMHQYT
ncbi:hypothetical protein PR048_018141 [Dryococelus australis]|uniref:Uncharacterized protein n=1 Tax=Dryococelus australis TaxID=614101 RepID=A0ABQ9HBG9_9NEOP|nr:hypothetical protein PR048_018141 [Dryococelus australis]